jgi:FO synthase
VILGPEMNIQAPPNLSAYDYGQLLDAGINDWGGISPVTPDHVNPEAPWPEVARLDVVTAQAGRTLTARLPLYPEYVQNGDRWIDPAMRGAVKHAADSFGFARADHWSPGVALTSVPAPSRVGGINRDIENVIARALAGELLTELQIVRLFAARGAEFEYVCEQADVLRQAINGDSVTYVVNRNINYTNICVYKCGFCAFSKGRKHEALRGTPYDLDMSEIVRRSCEAWDRGATEVCLQGGIHPHYTGETYLNITRAVREAVPDMHIHAFSPLEIWQGAATLGIPLQDFLQRLKQAGLDTLPGTAAEILDDEVRDVICPDKLNTAQWIEVIETAHRIGFRTTATIMFGHVERPEHLARHLIRVRDLQRRTGGFTEFVPLPFVHMQAPMALRGQTRYGPTFREVRLMHAVARLALHPHIASILASWVKLGEAGVKSCLESGANDLGGTLMDESISRAAGAQHGQELPPAEMERIIRSLGRTPRQRTTLYGNVDAERCARAAGAPALTPVIQTPPKKFKSNKALEISEHAT